jgi:hypothetical protein
MKLYQKSLEQGRDFWNRSGDGGGEIRQMDRGREQFFEAATYLCLNREDFDHTAGLGWWVDMIGGEGSL